MLNLRKCRIGVVGLGYVGLPLAVEFGKHFDTVGFDVKPARIAELRGRPRQHAGGRRGGAEGARTQPDVHHRASATCKRCRVFIVTVPTPIDEYKRPDLTPLCAPARASARC